MRRYLILGAVLAGCVAVGIWWDAGHGQAWMSCHTGTDTAHCPIAYGFWSGFGSVIPWALFSMGGILALAATTFRHVNCHEQRCWRIGRYGLAGGEFKVCGKHHPSWEGKHPPAGHMHKAHREWVAMRRNTEHEQPPPAGST